MLIFHKWEFRLEAEIAKIVPLELEGAKLPLHKVGV